MTPNQKPDAADFMEKWLAHNIVAHPTPQDLATALTALTHNCLDEAARAGISAAEIELQNRFARRRPYPEGDRQGDGRRAAARARRSPTKAGTASPVRAAARHRDRAATASLRRIGCRLAASLRSATALLHPIQ